MIKFIGKYNVVFLAIVIIVSLVFSIMPQLVVAAESSSSQDILVTSGDKKCGGANTSVISCDQTDSKDLENNGIYGILLIIINILSAGIGIAAVGGVVYAAVLYSSAGANADNIKKAKGMFVNIGIGIVAYLLMYSFLNYLIPGGLFN